MKYRRYYQQGATYFFTINLADRSSDLLIRHVDKLRDAFRKVKQKHPFKIDAIVILPDHLHLLCTLPEHDDNFSTRIRLIKYYFSHNLMIEPTECISNARRRKQERGIWQRRFWEHCIRDEEDFLTHMNYIHFNPVKHGYVTSVEDWQYSSYHRDILSIKSNA